MRYRCLNIIQKTDGLDVVRFNGIESYGTKCAVIYSECNFRGHKMKICEDEDSLE